MANLIPEKRLDKNGVLTTKHVRADPIQTSQKTLIPAPSVTDGKVIPTEAQKQKRQRVHKKKWECDEELAYIANAFFNPKPTYECSDAEYYDVLSVVGPETVYPLFCIGVRSSEDAQKFLERAELHHLHEDHSQIASEAMKRGYDASEFLEFATAYSSSTHLSTFMDAAGVHFDSDLQAVDEEEGYSLKYTALEDNVMKGSIRASDIHELGSSFIRKHASSQPEIYSHLMLLNKGRTVLKSVSEIKQVIMDAETNSLKVQYALGLASAYGPNVTAIAQGPNAMPALQLGYTLRETERSAEDNLAILEYVNSLGDIKVDGMMPDAVTLIALYDAGVNKDYARRGLIEGLTLEQTIALDRGEVAPGLAKGLL